MAIGPARRLDSWKEIADHIGRDVRTAIRWERERGLPVHRVPGGKRGSVFAFTDEIDRWRVSAVAEPGDGERASSPPPGPDAGPAADTREGANESRVASVRRLWFSVLLAAVVVALLGVALRANVLTQGPVRAPVAAISLAGTELVAFAEKRRVLLRHDFGRRVVPFEDPAEGVPARLFATDDLDGDGRPDVLVSARFLRDEPSRSRLYALSAHGHVLWSWELDDAITFGGGRFVPPWRDIGPLPDTGTQVAVFEVGGQRRIAWAQNHHTWWPSILTVLDATGRPLSKWVHSGLIYTVAPTTTPTGPLLLVGGVSNSREAAFFAVLSARDPEGAGPEEPGSPFECLSCGPGRPLRYFVIEPSEQMLTGAPYNQVFDIRRGDEAIEVRTMDSPPSTTFLVQAVLRFSLDFTLEHAAWSSGWAPGHRELERLGKLDHTVAECPERDRPPHVREWTPDGGWRDLTPPIAAAARR